MKLGIFSDVHGNLDALEAALAFFDDQHVAEYLCLGDIVGYGTDSHGSYQAFEILNVVPEPGTLTLLLAGLVGLLAYAWRKRK